MENIIEKIARQRGEVVAKTIEDYTLKVFKTPNWIKKWRWLWKIYAKLCQFEIRQHNGHFTDDLFLEFWAKREKIGELKITYDNKII